jgi:hypothetical protein
MSFKLLSLWELSEITSVSVLNFKPHLLLLLCSLCRCKTEPGGSWQVKVGGLGGFLCRQYRSWCRSCPGRKSPHAAPTSPTPSSARGMAGSERFRKGFSGNWLLGLEMNGNYTSAKMRSGMASQTEGVAVQRPWGRNVLVIAMGAEWVAGTI